MIKIKIGIAPAGSEYSSYGTIAKGQPSAEQQQQEIAPLPTLNNDALTNNSNDNKRATQGTTTVQEGGAINDPGKRRQWISPALAAPEPFVGGVPLPPGNGFAVAPAGPLPPVPPPPPGTCPGGASLPIECDPKRPWPQCPPQSYWQVLNGQK
jgi:hypothetical protein